MREKWERTPFGGIPAGRDVYAGAARRGLARWQRVIPGKSPTFPKGALGSVACAAIVVGAAAHARDARGP